MSTISLADTSRMVNAFAYKISFKYNLDFDYCLEEAQKIQCDCLESYDESKGAKFSSWLYQNLLQMYQWAWHEAKYKTDMPDYYWDMQMEAEPVEQEVECPMEFAKLAQAIVDGYGVYTGTERLLTSRKSLDELAERCGITRNQVTLQLDRLTGWLGTKYAHRI